MGISSSAEDFVCRMSQKGVFVSVEWIWKLLFVCPLLFLAGVIDGVAGGGGIISLPTYIMSGLPMNVAYGCNKMQSCLGTSASLYRYARSGYVDWKTALIASATAMAGSYASTRIMLSLNDSTIKMIVAGAMCFVITLTVLASRIRSGEVTRIETTGKNAALCLLAGLLIGLYDGFFGPGGGTVAMMLFTLLFHYDLRVGSGIGKLIIVISNLVALVNYIVAGEIWYQIAIPASLANIAGSYLGASLAMKKGRNLVKKIMLIVAALLVIQAIREMLG